MLAQKQMYDGSWLLHRRSPLKDVIVACLDLGSRIPRFFSVLQISAAAFQGLRGAGHGHGDDRALCLAAFVLRFLRQESIAGKLRQRILVVGWTAYAQRLKEIIEKDPSHPYEVVCCVPTPEGTFQQEPPEGVQRIDSYKAIRRLLNTLAIDIVLVADVNVPVKHWEALASLCEKELVQFKVVPSYFSILVSGLYLETLSGIPILGLSRLPLDRMFNKLVKRLLDIVGATVGLLLSVPIIAIFGALVYLESPGPILYRQRRIGRNGKIFNMLKIRSMRLDAEKDGKVGWSNERRPAPTSSRRVDAEMEYRRDTAILECPQRRNEPGRTTPGTPGIDSQFQGRDPALQCSTYGETGHHWLGSSERSSWRHRSESNESVMIFITWSTGICSSICK